MKKEKMSDERIKGSLSELKPMHSFDLWGVLLDQYVLGGRKTNLYKKIARMNSVPQDEIKRVVRGYREFMDGKPSGESNG